MSQLDYIVVGAGSAGAPVAARLAERGSSVLLLEAGDPLHKHFWAKVPIGIAKIVGNERYVWPFYTEAQSYLAGQSLYWPRGRLPGGSSSVNGALFVRGEPAAYDSWRVAGNTGWGYLDLLPYFKRMENTRLGSADYRGRAGPIHVSSMTEAPDELSDAFIASCESAGIPPSRDYNGSSYEGVSYLQLSTENGRRCSTAVGYLSHRACSNLDLQTGATVRRILFDGRRAIGVEYVQQGELKTVYAQREVILSAGPIKSPQILELSGIGDPVLLRQHGIDVTHALPGVGCNLIDHLQSRVTVECMKPITLNEIVGFPTKEAWLGLKYLLTRKGIMTTPGCTVHAIAKTDATLARPNVKIQLHHLSGKDRFEAGGDKGAGTGLDSHPGFSVGFFQLRPTSTGECHIQSPDPDAHPMIQPNYLKNEEDQQQMLAGIKLVRRVLLADPIGKYIKRETRPGPDMVSDSELLDYIRTSGQTSFHPIGTCRMGIDDMAVVSPELKVHGVENLRVVDSSIMPSMPSSNTNAPSIVIGEKAADLIGGRQFF